MTQKPDDARLTSRMDAGCLVIGLAGRWVTQAVAVQDTVLTRLSANGAKRARIDMSGVEELDTAGAWLVHRTRKDLSSQGLEVELSGGPAAYRDLVTAYSNPEFRDAVLKTLQGLAESARLRQTLELEKPVMKRYREII